MYTLIVESAVDEDVARHYRAGNKILVKRIFALLDEIKEHPKTGTGKPEPLRYKGKESWSRRIDHRHRLVYRIRDEELIVIAVSAYGHYEDK